MFILRGPFSAGMHLPGCLSGLQLQLSTVTADPRHNLFHRPLPGGLRQDNAISLSFFFFQRAWILYTTRNVLRQSDLSVYMTVLRSFLKWRSGLFRKCSHVSPFEHLVIFLRLAELYVDLHSPAAKLLKITKEKKKVGQSHTTVTTMRG